MEQDHAASISTRRRRIALAVRVRNEWDLLQGLLENVGPWVDEGWVLDDHSDIDAPTDLWRSGLPLRVIRATRWSMEDGRYLEASQRWRLLREIARRGTCDWVLQLDADERLATAEDVLALADRDDADAWVLPLFDFYLTPADANVVAGAHPERVRRYAGPEVRWQLMLFRTRRSLYIPGGDHREPQGFCPARVLRSEAPIVEHYGKAISPEDWDRKARFYSDYYPKYADKWRARIGQSIHHGVSDEGNPLMERQELAYDIPARPTLYAYEPDTSPLVRLKGYIHRSLAATLDWVETRETHVST